MTDQIQDVEPQEPIVVQLTLNVDQVNFILGALGKLPTESGAWIIRNIVGQQAQDQLDALKPKEETTEEVSIEE
jgi:hypothetical protein